VSKERQKVNQHTHTHTQTHTHKKKVGLVDFILFQVFVDYKSLFQNQYHIKWAIFACSVTCLTANTEIKVLSQKQQVTQLPFFSAKTF